MNRAVRVLCRPGTATGFALAGLEPVIARSPTTAADRLEELLREPDAGLLLVEDTLLPRPGEGGERDRQDHRGRAGDRETPLGLPMVLRFPGPSWAPGAVAPEAWVAEILRRAVGYRVRLR